jgi:hypothetical protein
MPLPHRATDAAQVKQAGADAEHQRVTPALQILDRTARYTHDMRYVMRERILSWGDDFTIKDTEGRDLYFVDGKVFSFGDKLCFRDQAGAEVARIDQKE